MGAHDDREAKDSDQVVLARSDRYLREVVEAHNLCPYARPSRLAGKIDTRLVRGADPTPALGAAIRELQQSDNGQCEAALLVAPDYPGTAVQWERLVSELAEQVAAELEAGGRTPAMYAVAFHPELAYGTDSPERLIGLLRHTPDPTVQLVRRSLVDRIRGTRGEACYLDVRDLETPEQALVALESMASGVSLSQHIAQANYATWRLLAGELERKLKELHAPAPQKEPSGST